MTSEMTASLSAVASARAEWAMLLALGAFHGVNPAMGWLFAVALGMQERRRGAVLRALVPLGAGHALAVAGAVGVALALGAVIPIAQLRFPIAGVLISLGVLRFFRHHHPRRASMRVGMPGLTVWSFRMATAHGAGLMVVPVFVSISMTGGSGHGHHMPAAAGMHASAALVATGLHAVGYLAVTAFVALLVFGEARRRNPAPSLVQRRSRVGRCPGGHRSGDANNDVLSPGFTPRAFTRFDACQNAAALDRTSELVNYFLIDP